jgi:hypothetical protein
MMWAGGCFRIYTYSGFQNTPKQKKTDVKSGLSFCCISLSTADSRQPTADSRQQTADSRQQTADSRQQTADSRQQITDKRQQTELT